MPMLVKAEYMQMPQTVEVFDNTDLIMRKNIQQEQRNNEGGEPYTVYICDEVQYKLNENIPKEQIEQNFDFWWTYIKQEQEEQIESARQLVYEMRDACGSYVGTGAAGQDNKNKVILGFVPSFFSIVDEDNNSVIYNGQTQSANIIFEPFDEGIEWYSAVGPKAQFNEASKKYYYSSFGK